MALYDYRRKIILTCILTRTTKQLKQKQQQTRNKRKCIGKQRSLSLDIWPIPNIGSVVGYSYV